MWLDCHYFRLWQKGLSDLPQRDVMTKLLMTFKTVKGFEERAKQLADSYGEYLDDHGSTSMILLLTHSYHF